MSEPAPLSVLVPRVVAELLLRCLAGRRVELEFSQALIVGGADDVGAIATVSRDAKTLTAECPVEDVAEPVLDVARRHHFLELVRLDRV
jgi:hypothetical protein